MQEKIEKMENMQPADTWKVELQHKLEENLRRLFGEKAQGHITKLESLERLVSALSQKVTVAKRLNHECVLKLEVDPEAVRAGDELRVGILLEHNRPETVIVPFRIWIEDAEGGLVASRTTEPQTFHHGDTVRRELTLRIPEGTPAGEYRVLVGATRMQQGLAGAERSFTVLGSAPPTLVPPSR